jgi:Ca2+-binding RTX toxin-like protein
MVLLGRSVTILAVFTLALVCLSDAFAASASVANGTDVLYTAASGEVNDVIVTETTRLVAVRIADSRAEIIAGPGCVAETPHRVRCKAPGFELITLALGDRNDSASLVDFGYGYEFGVSHADIHGGGGNDVIEASGGTDRLYGDGGADVLRASLCRYTNGYAQLLDGGPGDDDLKGGGCAYLVGGQGADMIRGTADLQGDVADYSGSTRRIVVTLDGKPGDGARGENDNVGQRIDRVYGGSADDLLVGNDLYGVGLYGGPGSDTLKGGTRRDFLRGEGGPDFLMGGGGSDHLAGQAGNDRILGGPGRDRCLGGSRNDVFFARDGFKDFLGGGPGRDRARIDVGVDRVRRVERRF